MSTEQKFSAEQVERIKKLFEESQEDTNKFRELVEADEELKSFSWEDVRTKAENLRLLKRLAKLYKELEEKLAKRVAEKALIEVGAEKLFEEFCKEVPDKEEPPSFLRDLEVFVAKAEEVVWTKETLEALEQAMRHGLPAETFIKYHSHIPQKFVEEKMRKLRGISRVQKSAEFIRGIGRITDVSKIDSKSVIHFKKTSRRRPYETGIKQLRWTASVINGANIGIKHSPLIEENPVRCALANARRNGDSLVILTNLIDLDLKKAGGTPQVYRSQISGYNTNVEILSPEYQQRAKAVLSGEEEGLIYENLAEKFLNILSGWEKIFMRPDGKPEFTGIVLGLLGPKEDEFIKTGTYWELHRLTIQRQKKLDVEISMAKHQLKEAMEYGAPEEEIEDLQKNLDRLIAERDKTRVSFHRPEDLQDYERRVRTFVVKMLEEKIPGLKIIAQRKAYVKIGEETVLFEIPFNMDATDGLLANFCNHYGPRVLRGEVPKTVVICQAHSPNFRMTVREVDGGGRRGDARIYVAPIAIDQKFLQSELNQEAKPVHQLEKAIWMGQFEAGVLRLNCANGVVNPDPMSVADLVKMEVGYGTYLENLEKCRYIWTYLPSDPHWGWGWKEFVHDPDSGRELGMCEAAIEMMRRAGICEEGKLPIHFFAICDDPTQGNHFQTQQQPHQHKMPFHRIEERWLAALRAAKEGDAEKRLEILREMKRLNLYQFGVRGEHWTQDQLEQVIERHLEPNTDFFLALLASAKRAGLVLRPVSDFTDTDHFPPGTPDKRDIGIVNFSTGNHFAATVNKEIMEGAIYAKMLRLMLRAHPDWKDKNELLEKLVTAPTYGNITVGWGTISVPGGYEWGIEVRNKPPRLSSWGDTLLGAVRNDEQRGNYSRIFDKRMTLKCYGDKHFFGAVRTGHTFYFMAAPGVPTEVYGELGFPPNNTGVSFVGLPAGGPTSGPILVRTLTFSQIRDYFKKPYKFDWEAFLPDPA